MLDKAEILYAHIAVQRTSEFLLPDITGEAKLFG